MAVQQFKGYLETGTINQNYPVLVNNVIVKPPYTNDGYRESFTGFRRGEKNTWLYKRDGFKQCFPGVFQDDFIGAEEYFPTDIVELNGKRYFYTVNAEHTKARIYVLCDINIEDNCTMRLEPGCCAGHYGNLSCYTLRNQDNTFTDLDYFPTTECTYDKFNVFKYIAGPTIYSSCEGVIRNQLVGNTIVSTLYNASGVAIPATVGQLVYIHSTRLGNTPLSVVGQVRNITGMNTISSGQPNNIVVDFPWLGLINVTPTITSVFDPSTSSFINTISNANGRTVNGNGDVDPVFDEIGGVCYTIMPDYRDVLGFATSDGLFVLHDDTCVQDCNSIISFGNTYQNTNNNTVPGKQLFTSFFTYGGQTGYFEGRTGTAYFGLLGVNNGYFTIQKAIQTNAGYDSTLVFGHYLILLGPNKMGIIYRATTSTFGVNDVLYEILSNDIGYFSRDSFINDKENFYLISNEKYLYKIDITPNNDYISTIFKIQFNDLSQFIRADLDMLDRGRGDKLFISNNQDHIRIFICDTNPLRINSDPTFKVSGTKVLFFDNTRKFWHKWMVCGIYLRNEKYGCWYGDGLWDNSGLTDNGEPVKQIIGMNFDQELVLTKTVQSVDILVGYQSNISLGNTLLKGAFDIGGYRVTRKYRNFQRAQYIQHIAAIKNKQVVDLFEDFPIGVGIFGGNGFDIDFVNYNNELDAYCGYEPIPQDKTLSTCDYSDTPNIKAGPCKSQYPIGWIENENDSNDEGYRQVSKFSVIRYPAGFDGENFYFEIMCDNNDAIEFGGFVFNFDISDNTVGIPNTLTYPVVTGNKLE